MLKALYGCVQASALWYENIHGELEKLRNEVSATDPCVFVKQVGNGRIFMLLLYVDDVLAIVDVTEVKLLKSHLTTKYRTVQFEMNEKLSYLGMEIEVSNYGTSIGMSSYVTQLVDEVQECGLELSSYNWPGTKENYAIKEGAESVSGTEKVYFHSTVAKLLCHVFVY
jgi:hypothetical protein